ncbi:transcription termination factor Rho [Nesterenkonia sp. MY13]|uniref:Transcription termination factor Rho n=1 Tax=Nesterenkonia sedimenti TaxID=1463632 RepID=A0A7X8YCF5_9MICC|nr:transcription termination factor Rho [Nesterenkonia sedimenti]NLS08513.1 transcription termination factor Rho [Nesterenkonia sedimenti]
MTETTTAVKNDAEQNGNGGANGLAGLKLAQLKALASQLGIAGSSRMRKSDLVEAISAHQRGGAVADRDKKDEKKDEKSTEQNGKAQNDKAEDSGKGSKGKQSKNEQSKTEAPKEEKAKDSAEQGEQNQNEQKSQKKDSAEQGSAEADSEDGSAQQGGKDRQRRGRDNRDRQQNHQDRQQDQDGRQDQDGSRQKQQHNNDGGGARNNDDDDDRGGRNDRRNRRRNRNDRNRRNRDRNRGPEHEDVEENLDPEQLIPIAGILDVLDNYAFVRTSGYLPGQNDVYVSLQQVKKNNLRKGDVVTGFIKAPNENQKPNKRQKFAALVKVEKVNGRPVEANTERVDFGKLTPLYPQERLRLESSDAKAIGPRVIDLVAPIGKGQRGLIVSPPKAGKTMILQSVANAIKQNNPEVHLMMVLVDERPEEVTDMQRTVDGEVIASTFDRPADDHTTVAELAIERAKRLVELGKDVVVLLDSMTRLGRAYNQAAPASGRILSGGVDASALYPPKRFFGAARNIENGGSLTILATALVETGSKMDEVIFEEFKGTGNMELRLSRNLADKRIFPAVDVNASSTRREEALLSQEEVKIMWKLRRVLSGLDQQQGLELLMNKLKETQSNAEFLMLVSKTTLGGNGDK